MSLYRITVTSMLYIRACEPEGDDIAASALYTYVKHGLFMIGFAEYAV